MENKINIIITEEPAEISRDDAKALARYNFITTYSGKDGVELMEKINNVKPDIVLMDMFMTRMDGVGVLRALKRKNPEKMPLVFVYSTFSSPVLEREIMNCGAVYFVLKPYNMEDIAESMVEAPSNDTDQQIFFKSPPHGFPGSINRIRIVLFPGQHDGFRPGLRPLVGVEIPNDQVWMQAQLFCVFKTAVTADDEIILP